MSEDKKPPLANEASDPQAHTVADERRRSALRKLGRGAAYAVPATISLMMMTRAAHAS